MANRAAAEKIILDGIGKIDPSGRNTVRTRELFKEMTDAQFAAYINSVADGADYVSINYENLKDSPITVRNNLEVAEELGCELFHHLVLTDASTGRVYVTPHKYPVLPVPIRRQIQMLKKKISIPEDNRHIDELTNQVTNDSKGSSLSFPELLVLYSRDLNSSITEMIKFRGGDKVGMEEMERSIRETGGANLRVLSQLGTRAKATETLKTMLLGMHFRNNF